MLRRGKPADIPLERDYGEASGGRVFNAEKSSFLSAAAPESDFGRDRKKQGQRCAQAINK